MIQQFFKICLLAVALLAFVPTAKAGSQDEVIKMYPADLYLIGLAEVQSSGDIYKDKRKTEIMARLEIAKQIKVSVKSSALDVMCEGKTKILGGVAECKDQFVEIIETSVDEVLQGSRIVGSGEDKSRAVFFSIAVLPRNDAAIKAEEHYKEAIGNTREFFTYAKNIKNDDELKTSEMAKAKKELLKAMAFKAEQAAIEKTKKNSNDAFSELEKEMLRLEN